MKKIILTAFFLLLLAPLAAPVDAQVVVAVGHRHHRHHHHYHHYDHR